MKRVVWVGFAALLVAAAGGCDNKKAEQTGAATSAISKEAKDIFDQRCATCHGADGKGTGAAAAALNPKPRDYTDKAWQASVTDDQLKKAIVGGGQSIGKSPLMPANPDLESKPDVVSGLVAQIRTFGK